MTTIYTYDANGLYIGASTSRTDPRNPSRTPLPANSTIDAPPVASDNQIAQYKDGAWSLISDYRGQMIYSTTDQSTKTVENAGDIEDGYTLLAPDNKYQSWDGSKWTMTDDDTAAQLADAKAAKLTEITRAKEQAVYSNITYHGVAYQADATAQLRITGAVASQQASFDWIAADNSVQTLTLAELSGLGQLIMTRLSAIVAQAAADKAKVSGYKSLAYVNKFTPDYSALAAQYDSDAASTTDAPSAE